MAGRHGAPPVEPYVPPVPVRQLPIARPWLYEAWNRFGWPHVERATGPVDVCHSTIAIPAATRAPHVVTVHDVAFVHTPERFSKHGARVMLAGLERCRAADLVLVPEPGDGRRSGRARLRERTGCAWCRGASRPTAVTDDDLARVRARHALPDRFVLFVGTLEPRKNLARLAAAVAPARRADPARRGRRDRVGRRGAGRATTSGSSGSSMRSTCRRSTRRRRCSRTRACRRGSACRSSRRWRTVRPWSRAGARRPRRSRRRRRPRRSDRRRLDRGGDLVGARRSDAVGGERAAPVPPTASWDATVEATVAAYREVACR